MFRAEDLGRLHKIRSSELCNPILLLIREYPGGHTSAAGFGDAEIGVDVLECAAEIINMHLVYCTQIIRTAAELRGLPHYAVAFPSIDARSTMQFVTAFACAARASATSRLLFAFRTLAFWVRNTETLVSRKAHLRRIANHGCNPNHRLHKIENRSTSSRMHSPREGSAMGAFPKCVS
ncbi:hypothetical protein B0H14DRAFT_2809975 [Mycena olivaceomarginata]|nr:hypothetical protein B0H14DRAFT_2809975 [Mycena olivaceomarginata]